METISCPKCGESATAKMRAEESMVSIPSQKVLFASRWFDIDCSQCGSFLHLLRGGHHGTQAETKLKKMFSKDKRKRLRLSLSQDEYKTFKETLEGKRMALDGEVEHWMSLC